MTSDNWDERTVDLVFEGQTYLWPRHDQKLLQVNDWVYDLNKTVMLMNKAQREFRVAVQAGGACGLWPLELAKHFDIVYTYEPEPLNYWCLAQNCAHLPQQIAHKNAALGEHPGTVWCKLPPSEKGNAGAFYTMDAEEGDEFAVSVPRVKLDDEPLFNVDLICLDLEGREVEALRGAQQLIDRFQPWIMIEEKPLPQMGPGKDVPHVAGAATEWLQKMHGYSVAGTIHRDVILCPPQDTESN